MVGLIDFDEKNFHKIPRITTSNGLYMAKKKKYLIVAIVFFIGFVVSLIGSFINNYYLTLLISIAIGTTAGLFMKRCFKKTEVDGGKGDKK